MAALRSDQEITQDVTQALVTDVRVDATRVNVESKHGVVILRGIVTNYYEKRVANEITNRIKGVRDVVNELQVTPRIHLSDDQTADDVQNALRRDVWIDEQRIQVQVVNGVVHLSGIVDDYTAKAYAEGDAWSVPGAVDVVNDIQIQPIVTRTDIEITNEVRSDLSRNIRIDSSRVNVQVQNGVVYLRGSVQNADQKWLCEEIAWWTAGVRDVVNELRVEP